MLNSLSYILHKGTALWRIHYGRWLLDLWDNRWGRLSAEGLLQISTKSNHREVLLVAAEGSHRDYISYVLTLYATVAVCDKYNLFDFSWWTVIFRVPKKYIQIYYIPIELLIVDALIPTQNMTKHCLLKSLLCGTLRWNRALTTPIIFLLLFLIIIRSS